MGSALACRLLLQHRMRVYDLRPGAMARFAELGATPTQNPWTPAHLG